MLRTPGALLITLFVWALVLLALYWVIRLAVRHALRDALRPEDAAGLSLPTRPAGRRPGPSSGD